jgi:hypothetical protein
MTAIASNGYFYGPPVIGRVANLTSANTARDGSGTLSTVVWIGTGGSSTPPAVPWMLKRLDIIAAHSSAAPDLADCVVTLFVTDGTTITPWFDLDIGNPAAASTILPATPVAVSPVSFSDIEFPAGSYPLLGITVAPTTGGLAAVMWGNLANA